MLALFARLSPESMTSLKFIQRKRRGFASIMLVWELPPRGSLCCWGREYAEGETMDACERELLERVMRLPERRLAS